MASEEWPADQVAKAEAFKALHEGPDLFIIPNPWDEGTARYFEAEGFKALATTSAGYAHSRGRLDGGITREEKLAHCRAITAATSLPVNADTENCYGDAPETVAETVRLVAAAGVVGCSVEDYTDAGGGRLYDFDHAVERVAAGVEAALGLGFPFTLTARAEALFRGLADLEDACRRLEAFEKAGADVVYAPGLQTIKDVRQVVRSVSRPVNVLARPTLSIAELADAGVKRVSLGGALYIAAMGGMVRAVREMTGFGTFSELAKAADGREVPAALRKWSE
jgi:2-methylisocitrate lyase-like PEP mutase family enzyme